MERCVPLIVNNCFLVAVALHRASLQAASATAPLKESLRHPSAAVPTSHAEKLPAQTTERKMEQQLAGRDSQNINPLQELIATKTCRLQVRLSAKKNVSSKPTAENLRAAKSIKKQAEKQVEKQAEKQTEKKVEKKVEKQVEKQTEKQAEKQVDKQAEKKVEKPADKQVEKQAEKQVEKQTEKPVDKQVEKPEEKLAMKSAEKASENPPQKPLEKPSEKPTESPALSKNVAQKKKINVGKKKRVRKREQMKENNLLKSDTFTWRVVKLLGSGGFGDVYKVVKENNADKQEYAMKTEMCEGDKRMLRLKVEVCVLGICTNVENPEKRKHFTALIDRGKTEKFKFLVMELVGPSLEDIRKNFVGRNFSKSTAMQAGFQALQAIGDLHDVGYLHRDIKPQNFAIGLGENEKTIYMLDFGIARKYTVGSTKQVKAPRVHVKFLGTVRFASRACHNGIEQGRKDDLETWIYMVYDMIDDRHGLPWKRLGDRSQVVIYKEKFFRFQFPNCYHIVPMEFKRLVEYVNGMTFGEEPDYIYMAHSIKSIAKENHIDMEKKLDWIGKSRREKRQDDEDSDETSEDNRYTGSDESDETDKQSRTKRAPNRKRMGVDTTKKNILQKKRMAVYVGH